MVFFVLTAGLSGTFSNFLIPLQVGARDMARVLGICCPTGSSSYPVGPWHLPVFVQPRTAAAGGTVYPPLERPYRRRSLVRWE